MPIRVANPFETVEDAINACEPAFHLPITELSGTTIADVSGNGRNGTLSGTVTLNDVAAPDGRPAALFGGGYIEIPDNAAFSVDATYGMTVGCLAKFTAPNNSTTKFLMCKGISGTYEWDFFQSSANQLNVGILTAGGTGMAYRVSTRSPVGTDWCLLMGRVQNRLTLASNNLDLYKDSCISMGDTTTTGAGTPYTDGTGVVRIAVRADGVGPFAGYIRNAFMVPEAIDQASLQRIVIACQREGWGF